MKVYTTPNSNPLTFDNVQGTVFTLKTTVLFMRLATKNEICPQQKCPMVGHQLPGFIKISISRPIHHQERIQQDRLGPTESRRPCPYPLNPGEVNNVTPFTINASLNQLFIDQYRFWTMYRDSSNGLYCDGMSPTSASTCSSFYSSASTGWGLFIDAIAAETGLISNDKAKENALLTLQTINDKWPRDSRGWFSHWTSPGSPDYIRQSDWEYSTIDSSIMIAGAVFAGNYFGGELSTLADSIKNTPDWNGSVDSGFSRFSSEFHTIPYS